MDPTVEEHWPHLAELHRMLNALPSTITIHAMPADDKDLAEAVARHDRRNGK